MVRLGDVCTVQRGVRVTRKDLNEFGKYNVFQNSLKPLGKFDSFNCDANNPFVIMALAAGEVGFSNQPFWAADDCTYFTDLKNLDCKYLYFILLKSRQELRQNVKQATIPRLSNKFLEGLSIPLPPLPVQREIVERLERELAESDNLAANFKRIAELADAEFKAEIDETFERVVGRRVRLGDVCDFVYGFPFNSYYFNDGGVGKPLIRIRDVVPGVTSTFTTESAPPKYNVADGDLLVGMDGDFNLAQWSGGPALLNQRVCMFKPKPNAISTGFIKYSLGKYLKSIWEKKPFATVKHLSAKDLHSVFMPLPPLPVQHEIVARLEKELGEIENLKAAAERGLRLAATLRAAILTEAFAP